MSQRHTSGPDGAVVTKNIAGSVSQAVARFCRLLDAHGMKLFAIIDHSGEAHRVGLDLQDTRVVIFGKPESGTAVMQAVPLAALDLPLRVLIWDDDGNTKVTYTAPADLAQRHGLSDPLAQRLSGIGPLTDALVASD